MLSDCDDEDECGSGIIVESSGGDRDSYKSNLDESELFSSDLSTRNSEPNLAWIITTSVLSIIILLVLAIVGFVAIKFRHLIAAHYRSRQMPQVCLQGNLPQ